MAFRLKRDKKPQKDKLRTERQSVFEMKREFKQSKTSKSPKEMLGAMKSYYKDLMK